MSRAGTPHNPDWCYVIPDDPPIEVRHLAGAWFLVGGAETHCLGDGPLSVNTARSIVSHFPSGPVTPVDYPPFTVEGEERIEVRHLGGRWWQVNGQDIGFSGGSLTPGLARRIWARLKAGETMGAFVRKPPQ